MVFDTVSSLEYSGIKKITTIKKVIESSFNSKSNKCIRTILQKMNAYRLEAYY